MKKGNMLIAALLFCVIVIYFSPVIPSSQTLAPRDIYIFFNPRRYLLNVKYLISHHYDSNMAHESISTRVMKAKNDDETIPRIYKIYNKYNHLFFLRSLICLRILLIFLSISSNLCCCILFSDFRAWIFRERTLRSLTVV